MCLLSRANAVGRAACPVILSTRASYSCFLLQTPKEIVTVIQTGMRMRHIYLNVPHSTNLKPSWYGESIGHYEGTTLVVDTIGLNDKTFVDNYRTPHTDKIHVVERYTLSADSNTLEILATVDDPGAFTTPWSALQRYKRVKRATLAEDICAENNSNYLNEEIRPIPQADKADF